jgi:hypothetical protein
MSVPKLGEFAADVEIDEENLPAGSMFAAHVAMNLHPDQCALKKRQCMTEIVTERSLVGVSAL